MSWIVPFSVYIQITKHEIVRLHKGNSKSVVISEKSIIT